MTKQTRSYLILILVLFSTLALITFIPYEPARDVAKPYFPEADIDVGLQYAFERRLLFWVDTAVELALLCSLALTGLGRRLADVWLCWTDGRRILAACGVGLCYFFLHEVLSLPFGVGRFYHAQSWGMSNLDLERWLQQHLLSLGVSLVIGGVVLSGFYLLLTFLPRIWWLLAPVGGAILGMTFAFLAPLLISPLFNDFTPLSETPWRHLKSPIQGLVTKAGVPVEEILVMDASQQSNHSNAYFTGFGSTRRIVLYDNLLRHHSDAEVESVLAHELGHWQHDHITKGILLGAFAALFGFFVLDRLLRFALGRAPWRLQSIADPGGLPLILLLMNLGEWAAMPVGNAVSRHFERQADQASLDLANQPAAFIAGEINMARQNKANVAPTPWNVWLFASHPSTVERIRMAEEFERTHKR